MSTTTAETATDATQEATGATQTVDTTTATTDTATATQDATQDTAGESPEDRIARLEKAVKDANAEAAKYRVRGKTAAEEAQADLAQKIAQALGITKADEQPTVESLTTQVTEATTAREEAETAARAARVELAVYRNADTAGADPQALLDSRTFTDSLADVDPTDVEAITAAIKTAVTNNPRLRKTQVVGASSVDHAGGSGEGAITPEKFKTMSGADRNELARRDPTTYARLTGRQ